MPRFYQISLRTILEVVFVAAVVLAFFYWRNIPRDTPPGRYQTIYTEHKQLLFTDAETGEMWLGSISDRGKTWVRVQGPPIGKAATGNN
jgi:hypothetical protein